MESKQIEQLVASAKKGDNQAFRDLYDYSYEVVQKECLKNLHNSLDAEDAIQETYLSVFKRLGSLKEPEKFLGWVRTIAHNTCVDYIIRQKRKVGKDDFKPPVSDDRFEGMDRVNLEDQDLSPEDRAEQEMIHNLLQSAMDDIPVQRATCLALYQQGMSYREISEQLSIPLGTVKSNVYYAKKALKKKIEKIEKEQNVSIHGFALVPVTGGGVQVQLNPQPSSAFISAESSAAPNIQERIWDKLSQHNFHKYPRRAFWKKAAAILLVVAIIAAGIYFAIENSGHTETQNSGNRRKTVESHQDQKNRSNHFASNQLNQQSANSSLKGLNRNENNSSNHSGRTYLTQESMDALSAEIYFTEQMKKIITDEIRENAPYPIESIQFQGTDWHWNGTTLTIGTNAQAFYLSKEEINHTQKGCTDTIYMEMSYKNIYKEGNQFKYEKSPVQNPSKTNLKAEIKSFQMEE